MTSITTTNCSEEMLKRAPQTSRCIGLSALNNDCPSGRTELSAFAHAALLATLLSMPSGSAHAQVFDAAPIGTVVAFAGRIAELPPNWHVCDGSAVSAAAYPRLAERLGDAWGGRPSADSVFLPDMRDMFMRGVDPLGQVDEQSADRQPSRLNGLAGAQVGTRQTGATALPRAGFPTSDESNPHSHEAVTGARAEGGQNTFDQGDGRGFGGSAIVTVGENTQGHTHPVSGGDPETRPVNVGVVWIIRIQ